MDINQIKREVTWYTDEIRANEQDFEQAKNKARELEGKIRDNRQKLEQFKRDLSNAEYAEQQKKSSNR